MFLKYDSDDTSEQALDETEDIVYRRTDFADRLEDITVEDHLPLYAAFWREKRGGMDGELEFKLGTSGQTHGGAPNGGSLERKKHAAIGRGRIRPIVFANEAKPEALKPTMSTGICGTQCISGGERYAGTASPIIHILDVA